MTTVQAQLEEVCNQRREENMKAYFNEVSLRLSIGGLC